MAIAVVTGSSSGIGQATAVPLARAGHTVYATMRNPKAGGEELRAIAQREKLPFRYATLDVDSDFAWMGNTSYRKHDHKSFSN